MIRGLYKIEREARENNLTPEELYDVRQQESRPKVNEFFDWLESTAPVVGGSGSLSKAFKYALTQKERLKKFLDNSVLSMDNNLAENAIRPFVVGRKNWLFAGHPNGASASATFFSLIETAKANGLEPYAYLRCLFKQLPLVKEQDGYRELLPQYIDPDLVRTASA